MDENDLKELFGDAMNRYNMGFTTEYEFWCELFNICGMKAANASHE